MSLMLNTLRELKGLGRGESSTSSAGIFNSVKVPQYDKSLRGGRGNQSPIVLVATTPTPDSHTLLLTHPIIDTIVLMHSIGTSTLHESLAN